jgi:hypothetical protein
MTLLSKEFDNTWTGKTMQSNLDHVIASKNLKFKKQGMNNNKPFFVKVSGWQQLQSEARNEFVKNISDHCLLFVEIEK